MVNVYATCGPSGSGKNRLYKIHHDNWYKHCVYICPDDIRKELTGNVSCQSKNKEVWYLAYSRMKDAILEGKDVYFNSTMCSIKSIKTLIENINLGLPGDNSEQVWLYLLVFPKVSTFRLKFRVFKDLIKKEERSNTLKLIKKDNKIMTVVGYQNKQFDSVRKYLIEKVLSPSQKGLVKFFVSLIRSEDLK